MKPDSPAVGGTLEEIARVFAEAHGLDISRYDEAFLRKTISKRMAATGAGTIADYGEKVAVDRAEAGIFFRALRIDHSEFFRNPLAFAVIEKLVLPGLVEAKKKSGGEVRVWSAGCASGQEAWSLAILLEELAGTRDDVEQASRLLVPQQTGNRDGRPTFPVPVSYRIFATDLAEPDFARVGVYSAEAVGNVRSRHLQKYFSRQGESFSVVPRLRARVDFSAYDLLDRSSASPAASIYGGFDLILCCNLLFYYRQEARQHILDKICHALSPGGYFVTGEVERAMVAGHQGLRAVMSQSAVFEKPKVSP